MKWDSCKYCIINGKCENQDRGYRCKFVEISEYYNNVNINCNYPDKISRLKAYIKKLTEENEELKERNGSLNIRDINLCRIANGIRDENFALKRLLVKSHDFIARYQVDGAEPTDAENIEFLSELEMLLNPKNVTENVANHKMQHCESQTNLHITDE